jgi:hypothetical protein
MRSGSVLLSLVAVALLVTGCTPTDAPAPSGQPTSAETLAPTDGAPELDLADDVVFALTALATAPNGAELDIAIIVHEPHSVFDETADAAGVAIYTWCAGEVDVNVARDLGYTFSTIDVNVVPRSGSWPADAQIVVHPQPQSVIALAAAGALTQRDLPFEAGGADPSPHCAWPGVIDSAGAGLLYLGIAGDSDGDGELPPRTGWAGLSYGVSSAFLTNQAAPVTFSDCAAVITPLGEQLGAPSANWASTFGDSACVEGGATGD